MDLIKKIEEHYLINWGECTEYIFNDKEPIHNLLPFFKVLKLKPNEKRNSWIYATCGPGGVPKLGNGSQRMALLVKNIIQAQKSKAENACIF